MTNKSIPGNNESVALASMVRDNCEILVGFMNKSIDMLRDSKDGRTIIYLESFKMDKKSL